MRLGALQRAHRERVREILDATAVFRAAEVSVALELFDDAGLELIYQNFRPPEDVGGLSIIHALFNDAIPEGLC